MAGALNRPRDQVRKQTDEECVVDERPRGLQLPLVAIDDVSDFLKGVKRDPRRKQNREDPNRRLTESQGLERGGHRIHEEVEVLEDSKKSEVDRERNDE